MAKRQTVEEKLAGLARLAGAPRSEEVESQLRKALGGANAVLAAKAAQVVATREAAELVDDVEAMFRRFLDKGAKGDKGCLAKTAAVEALERLGCRDAEVFLLGSRCRQMEPVFGGVVDTAADMRATCALALARVGHPEVRFELVRLLMDPEATPRRAAARSLGGEDGELLLRLKVLSGDPQPEVLGECFSSLIAIDPDRSMSFVKPYLASDDLRVAEEAAFALGASRSEEAFAILRESWEESIDTERKEMLLAPIAQVRRDEAFDFLLEAIAHDPRDLAVAAVKAIAICARDEDRRRRVAEAVAERGDPAVAAAYRRISDA